MSDAELRTLAEAARDCDCDAPFGTNCGRTPFRRDIKPEHVIALLDRLKAADERIAKLEDSCRSLSTDKNRLEEGLSYSIEQQVKTRHALSDKLDLAHERINTLERRNLELENDCYRWRDEASLLDRRIAELKAKEAAR